MKLTKKELILLNIQILISIFMLLNYFNQLISPKITEYFGFISLLFPIFIIYYILLLVYWIITNKYKLFLFYIYLFLLYCPNIILWLNFSKKEESINNVKIISYNVFYGKKKGMQSIANYIKNQNPDVVLLQEIWSRQWKKRNNLLMHYNNAIFPFVSISSKYPIINKHWINLYNTNGYGCWADIIIKKDTIRFFSIYLEPIHLTKRIFKIKNKNQIKIKFQEIKNKIGLGFKIHQNQLKFIKNEIKKSPYPVVVGGDLNAVPNSYEYFQLSSFLEDGFKVKGNGFGTTFHEYFYPIKIDYIFFDCNFKILYTKVDQTVTLSDHFPIITFFKKKYI